MALPGYRRCHLKASEALCAISAPSSWALHLFEHPRLLTLTSLAVQAGKVSTSQAAYAPKRTRLAKEPACTPLPEGRRADTPNHTSRSCADCWRAQRRES